MNRLHTRRSVAAAVAATAASQTDIGRATAQSSPVASPVAAPLQDLSENERRAVAVLEALESGDPATIERYVSAETYIQHNLAFPSGRQTLLDALSSLREAGTTVSVHRVIEDGDLVALHSDYNLFGPTIGFDVFRFEDGLIVEHWDNLQETVNAADTVSGRSMIDGPTEVADLDQTEANKALARGLIEDVLMGRAPERITDYISTERYDQHNPNAGDGLEGLSVVLADLAERGIQIRYDTLHQVIGEGNFVLTMSEGAFGDTPTAFYDLFRIEDGKIVEHWDVIETIPPASEHQNDNGKF